MRHLPILLFPRLTDGVRNLFTLGTISRAIGVSAGTLKENILHIDHDECAFRWIHMLYRHEFFRVVWGAI